MTAKQVLEKALALMGPNGENWVQRQNLCLGDEKTCVLLSMSTAIGVHGIQVGDSPYYKEFVEARNALEQATNSKRLIAWNDTPGRTFSEVKAAFEAAITATS